MDSSPWKRIPAPVAAIVTATVLFGSAMPFLKLLTVQISPLFLIAILSLGAGSAGLCWLAVRHKDFSRVTLPKISTQEKYLLAATVLIGGLLAPVIQLTALAITPAAVASLLLNF